MRVVTTITDLVREALTQKGYDGLLSSDGNCGCDLDDLMPCFETLHDCSAAYKQLITTGTAWEMVLDKPGETTEKSVVSPQDILEKIITVKQ